MVLYSSQQVVVLLVSRRTDLLRYRKSSCRAAIAEESRSQLVFCFSGQQENVQVDTAVVGFRPEDATDDTAVGCFFGSPRICRLVVSQ